MKRTLLALVLLFGMSALVSAAPLDRVRSLTGRQATVRQSRTVLQRVRTTQSSRVVGNRQIVRTNRNQPVRSTWSRTVAAVRRVSPFGG